MTVADVPEQRSHRRGRSSVALGRPAGPADVVPPIVEASIHRRVVGGVEGQPFACGLYDRRVTREKRLTVVLLLNLLLVTALVIVGLWAHSLGVLAAGGDYIADAAAIGLSLFAIWLSRRPPSPRRPDGYPNATNIAALVNGGCLLALSVLIIIAAIRRRVSGTPHIEGLPVLIVSAVAAGVMVVGAFILGGDIDDDDDDDDEEDLNIKAVLLDTAADAAAAGGVAITGAIILAAGGLYWLDPLVALIIALIVGYHALRLVLKVVAAIKSSKPERSGATAHHEV